MIRIHGRHIFNPSNFGLVVCFVILGSTRADPLAFWWGPMSPWMVLALTLNRRRRPHDPLPHRAARDRRLLLGASRAVRPRRCRRRSTSPEVLGQVTFEFRLSIAQILVSLLTCAVLEFTIMFRRDHVIRVTVS